MSDTVVLDLDYLSKHNVTETYKTAFQGQTGTPTAESGKAAPQEQAGAPAGGGVDPIVLAFFYLMEASSTTADSAIIYSKQLSQNAIAQQQLDNQDAELQWCYVPKLQVNQHSTNIVHYHHHAEVIRDSIITWTTKTTHWVRWTTEPNAGAVNNAEAQNQQVIADRQTIAEHLNVLQQTAQVGETGVNSFTDESMQSMQQASNLMQILQSLTFQALMRQPPQG